MEFKVTSYYDPRTMQYVVDNTDGTSDRVCVFSNTDISNKKKYIQEDTIVKNNKNAEYISKYSSALNGLSKSIVAAGIGDTPNNWWDANPTHGGFKANPNIPPVVAVKSMEDLKSLSWEISKTNNAKINFIGLIGLSYRDLSYNDGSIRIETDTEYVNSYNYIGYVFSYGSTSNQFCLRIVDGDCKFDKNVVDIMNGFSENGISKDLQDFIKECRDIFMEVYNEK